MSITEGNERFVAVGGKVVKANGKAVTIDISSAGADISLNMTGATAGQIAQIATVDTDGKPTAWEAVDIPQSDWEQSDATTSDYIKNRPFYADTVVVPFASIPTTDAWEIAPTAADEFFSNISSYTVRYNGTDYHFDKSAIVTWASVEFQGVGGKLAENSASFTSDDIPFVISRPKVNGSYDGQSAYVGKSMSEPPEDIKIFRSNIKQIDPKFLPANRFVVTVTQGGNGNFTADKTISEIVEAYEAEKDVVASFAGQELPLHMISNGNTAVFDLSTLGDTSQGLIIGRAGVILTNELIIPRIYPVEKTSAMTNPVGVDIDGKLWSKADTSLAITGATVGQLAKITAVDDSGKPTAWEAVDDRLPNPNSSNVDKALVTEQIGEDEYAYGFARIPDISDFINLGINGASTGQFAKVKSVDQSGQPVLWETVNMSEPFVVTVTWNATDGKMMVDKTHAEVVKAYAEGKQISAKIVDYSDVVESGILPLCVISQEGAFIFSGLAENFNGDTDIITLTDAKGNWSISSPSIARLTDIPTALPNPNALTVKVGDTTTTYDGSAAKTVEITDAGELVTATTEILPAYTNQIPLSVDASGAIYNGVGYKPDVLLNSSGSEVSGSGTFVSGFIPVKKGDIIRVKDTSSSAIDTSCVFTLTSSKAGAANCGKTISDISKNALYGTITINGNVVTWDTSGIGYYFWNSFSWLRVTTTSANSVVTVNEEIKDVVTVQNVLKSTVKVKKGNLDFDIASPLLSTKTIVCFGDSIFGMIRDTTSVPAWAASFTGAKVYNVGFGGCRMAVHPTDGYAAFSMWALADAVATGNYTLQDAQAASGANYFPTQLALLKSIDFGGVDIIVIHYGTNDFTGGVAIDNADDDDDTTTLCGALRYALRMIQTAYPKIRVFVSLPIYRKWDNVGAETYTNANGKKLREFCTALAEVADEFNCPFIDGYKALGINAANASAFLADGTHLNEYGRQAFGEYIGGCLISPKT